MDCSPTLYPTRLLCPWDFPGKNTGGGCHFHLQGIFLTQGSNLDLLHCRQILYHLSHQGSQLDFNYTPTIFLLWGLGKHNFSVLSSSFVIWNINRSYLIELFWELTEISYTKNLEWCLTERGIIKVLYIINTILINLCIILTLTLIPHWTTCSSQSRQTCSYHFPISLCWNHSLWLNELPSLHLLMKCSHCLALDMVTLHLWSLLTPCPLVATLSRIHYNLFCTPIIFCILFHSYIFILITKVWVPRISPFDFFSPEA